MDDLVFRALADPTRRRLLDELLERDGQTLAELQAHAPEMTRFGVMKHLGVLEEAGLITSRKQGREKHHYLNPVPIRLVHDRWVSKYAHSWVTPLAQLKTDLEGEAMSVSEREAMSVSVSWQDGTAPVADGTAVFEIYIKTMPERLWQAITDPEQRARYSFGVATESDWTPGSEYHARSRGGFDIATGHNIEVDPPRRLVQTFRALFSDQVKDEPESRVTWEIEPVGSSCRLTVIHDRLRPGANAQLYGGWPMILSGLKTLLESGESLDTPGSLMYAGR